MTLSEAKLVAKTNPDHYTIVEIGDGIFCGGNQLLVIGGPCTVESSEQMEQVASQLALAPVQAIRGGVFKPRTSPYAFQGMREAGVEILSNIARNFNVPVVSEVMCLEQVDLMSPHIDVLQVGSRNMQNYDLLKRLGEVSNPILLKRGLSATIDEFLLAAEYILYSGNPNVILCERGIRSFDTVTRNVLDLGAVVALKQITHLPVIVDPSHAAGKRELVPSLALAAIACGADGLIVEAHPEPDKSVSDARQALSLQSMVALVSSLRPVAEAVGRNVRAPKNSNHSFK
jgi:3-deoxy-7-phosphoheptulonate synthase